MIYDNDPECIRNISPGRILGIDFGMKRIGLAMSDPLQMLASTFKTLLNKHIHKVVDEICEIVGQNQMKAIVVGQPLHMSGDAGQMADKVREFVEKLESRLHIPIFLWDERWTTVSAEKLLIETGMSPSRNRDKIDQLAAAYLLQGFLDRLTYLKRSS